MRQVVKNILLIYLLIPLLFAALCTPVWNFKSPLFGIEVSFWTVFRVLLLGISTARVLSIGWGGKG